MATLDQLRAARQGWDGANSQPLDPQSEKHYLDFLDHVRADRLSDSEPIMNDRGFICLEWESAAFFYTAKIGIDSLYMCVLAPDSEDDDNVSLDYFDMARLVAFFEEGSLSVSPVCQDPQ